MGGTEDYHLSKPDSERQCFFSYVGSRPKTKDMNVKGRQFDGKTSRFRKGGRRG
jgi:hypothetical protein